MNTVKNIALTLIMAAFAIGAQAKPVQPEHVYMFGFSASFKDSTIYVTDIQDIKGAWIDNKSQFLLSRDNYSYQLKEYFVEKRQQPDRVCMVFFATSQAQAEKQMKKLMKKYIPAPTKKKGSVKVYEVQYLTAADFQFTPIDMSSEQ